MYGIIEGHLDYSFYLTVVGAVLCLFAAVLGAFINFNLPEPNTVTEVSLAQITAPPDGSTDQVSRDIYPPQLEQAYTTPSLPVALGYDPQFLGGAGLPHWNNLTMTEASNPTKFNEGISNPGYEMDPPPYSEIKMPQTDIDAKVEF